jgi:hypothetical protein
MSLLVPATKSHLLNKVLTIEELQQEFPGEWVLLEDPETTETLMIKSGKQLWHTPDREELDNKLLELRPDNAAVWYLGRTGSGKIIML